MVDHTLECRRCIADSERPDSVFEKAVLATERWLPFVSLLDVDEVVAVLEVDFVEIFRASNTFPKLVHVVEGVTVADSDQIDCSVVNA